MIFKKWHPELFQGREAKAPYFEGWYFKQIDTDGRMLAIIPGIQKSEEQTAFIQVIYGSPPVSEYISYSYDSFNCSENTLKISIGDCLFSEKELVLNISDEKGLCIKGNLTFIDTTSLKSRLFNPGIMGWYQLMPRMECLHGLVSANHKVKGEVLLNGEKWTFDNSPGYIEKDWGHSFPQSWIWTQCNSFKNSPGTSVMLSIARVPWIGRFFTGFLGFVYHDEKMYRFGTYTGHKLTGLELSEKYAEISISGKSTSFIFKLQKGASAILKAPDQGSMHRDIEESTNGRLTFILKDSNLHTIIEETGVPSGVEIVGDPEVLRAGIK